MKYKDYAVQFLTTSSTRKERHLVALDENNADIISLRKGSDASERERPAAEQLKETPQRLINMVNWTLDELLRETRSDPNIVHCVDAKGSTLMHMAAKSGRIDVLEFIIDHGGLIDAKDAEDNTPCHWAVCKNQPESLRTLVDAGADTTILNLAKMAPIHIACDLNKPDMIEILASRKDFDPNLLGDHGQSPIHFCATKNSVKAARKLLKYKPRLCQIDDHGVFPILRAATHGSKCVLEIIVSEGEKYGYTRAQQFSYKDKEHNTVLHAAVNGGCKSSVQVCLDAGAPPDVQQDDDSTPLHLASSQGAMDVVKLLVDADKGLRTLVIRDVEEMTPLHKAAMFDHVHVVEFLLDMGAELDAVDKQCRTPLLLATLRGAWRTSSLLLQRGASHTHKDDQSRNLMHLIVLSGGNIGSCAVQVIKKEGLNDLIDEADDHGHTPMHYATRDGNIKSLQGLLELGATVTCKNKQDQQSPLHFAARYGRFNSCKRLLNSSIGHNIINDPDGKGMTALHIASWNGHTKVIRLLMLRGALLHRDHGGRTPLHLAAMAGYIDSMRVLLSTHSFLLDQIDRNGDSALHLAARENQGKAVGYLLTSGACLFFNHKQQSVFDIVIEKKNQDVALAMIRHDRWDETLSNYSSPEKCPITMLIENMPEIMMKVLDRCVTISEHDALSADLCINYNFRYLEPSLCQRQKYKQSVGYDTAPLPALNAMVRHNQVDLLSHPLCIEYINSKWRAYGAPIHYGYMLIFLLFVTLFTYIIASVNPTPVVQDDGSISHNINGTSEIQVKHAGQHIALAYIVVYACINIIKEFYQMYSQGYSYVASTENYAEWILYVCTLTFSIPFWIGISNHYQWAAGSIAIFFAWFNFLMYQEKVDRIGIFIVMFNEILKTILQVMAMFSVIIIAFGLSFYMLMSGEINHAFKSPEIAIFRVFSMMMGELDFINSFVDPLTDNDPATLHYSYLSYIFLVALVVLLPILLMNLLIGLAVGDIAVVQRNAKLKRLAMQVDLHSEYESKLPIKILQYVTKDQITLRPNAECGRSYFKFLDKIKEKYIIRSGGSLRVQAVLELKSSDKKCQGEMEKLEQRMKAISSKLDKQHDLLRLIVQKMEIHTEADEQDEGEAPPGNEEHGIKTRLRMSSVVTAAISTAVNTSMLQTKSEDAALSVTLATDSPTSNGSSDA